MVSANLGMILVSTAAMTVHVTANAREGVLVGVRSRRTNPTKMKKLK